MKRTITAICVLALCFAPLGATLAQDDDGGNLSRIYEIQVKDGHGDDLVAGAKAWVECYAENDGKRSWGVHSAETGKLGRYVFMTGGHDWAAFDQADEAGRACQEVLEEKLLPHVASSTGYFTARMDDLSRPRAGDYSVAQVIHFSVGNNHRFVAAISRITEAAREAEWGNFMWHHVIAGGHHASDFYVVIPQENFAGFGGDNAPLWEMVESVHGKAGAEEIRAELDATVEHQWSDIWKLREEMSFRPGQED